MFRWIQTKHFTALSLKKICFFSNTIALLKALILLTVWLGTPKGIWLYWFEFAVWNNYFNLTIWSDSHISVLKVMAACSSGHACSLLYTSLIINSESESQRGIKFENGIWV